MKWFKFYGQDWLTDIKILSLSSVDRLVYITILCLASSEDSPGTIPNCRERDVIRLTHLNPEPIGRESELGKAHGCFDRFIAKGMITVDNASNVTVVNYMKRQEKDLTGYERVKRYRNKQKMAKSIELDGDNDDNIINDNARIDKIRIDNNDFSVPSKSSFSEEPTELDDTTYEQVDEDGNSVTTKKKGVRSKTPVEIKKLWGDWVIKCQKELGVSPVGEGVKTYKIIEGAMKKLTPEQMKDLLDEWFDLGRPSEETIQITRALSNYQINGYLARNR